MCVGCVRVRGKWKSKFSDEVDGEHSGKLAVGKHVNAGVVDGYLRGKVA